VAQTEETEDELPGAAADSLGEHGDEESVSALAEQVGRHAGTLVLRELQLTGSRHLPAIRRAGRDVAAAGLGMAALITAFVLANWGAVVALSNVVPSWLAPLLLAAAWAVVGVLLLVSVRHRLSGLGLWWRGEPEEVVRDCERTREEAEAELRATLERFAGAVAAAAEERIRDAVMLGADGIVDAGEDILETADDLTDAIEEALPGGGVVNGVLDLVLLPGRAVIKVARVTIARPPGEIGPAEPDATNDRSDG
jgi:hypothetical protein